MISYSPDREIMCSICHRETATHEWEGDYGTVEACTDCYMDQWGLVEGEYDDDEE